MLGPSTKDVIRIARTYAYKNGLSMTAFAKQAGVSKAWLSRLHHGDGDLSLEYANKLLSAAGYKLIIKHQSQLSESDTQPIDMIDDDTTLKNDDKNQFKEKGKNDATLRNHSDDEDSDDSSKKEEASFKRLRRRVHG